ncbi:hypothetical protein WUBG_16717, partial [Wuchereria bancrofti]
IKLIHDISEETSALAITKPAAYEVNAKPKKINKTRSCAFCNKDHWSNECNQLILSK